MDLTLPDGSCPDQSAAPIDPRPDTGGAGDLLSLARKYVAAGLSVIPIKADGSKAPALAEWKEFQRGRPTPAELVQWFARGEAGIGIPCGAVSGGLAALDFETAEVWNRWRKDLPAGTG